MITIDTSAGSAPTIGVADADMSYIDGTVRFTRNPHYITLSGTGPAGANLMVFNDLNNDGIQDPGEPTMTLYAQNSVSAINAPVINSGGTYTYDLVYLTDGVYNLRAVTTDAAGNSSTSTSAIRFELDRSVSPNLAIALAPIADYAITITDCP